jgi:hypothetical protein
MSQSRRIPHKIKESSVEAYLCAEIKRLGGIQWKNNPGWYVGIPDRTVCVRGYMCVVELKRPKGGRLAAPQKLWKKFVDNAGGAWHLISTHEGVDEFITMVLEKERIRNDTGT